MEECKLCVYENKECQIYCLICLEPYCSTCINYCGVCEQDVCSDCESIHICSFSDSE